MPVGIIGVLALQGGFIEHVLALNSLGYKDVVLVKSTQDAKLCDGFIIPGGESTVIAKLADKYGLLDFLQQAYLQGKPIWGICAGAIICANYLKIISVEVARNAYGRQVSSTVVDIFGCKSNQLLGQAVLIRAPKFYTWQVYVEPLVQDKFGNVLALMHKNCIISSFHPELAESYMNWHKAFIGLVNNPEGEFNIDFK